MSHSQFHSINLFILRHAWLNLWDKHMTTGRINQVTTFPVPCPMKGVVPHSRRHQSAFWERSSSSGEFVWTLRHRAYTQRVSGPNCLVSRSHTSWTRSSGCRSNLNHVPLRELPTASHQKADTTVADSQVNNCKRLGHWQVIRIPQQCKLPKGSLTSRSSEFMHPQATSYRLFQASQVW